MRLFLVAAFLCLVMSGPVLATDFYHNNNVVKLKTVQFDSRYYLGLDGYYSVGQKLSDDRHQQENDQLRLDVSKLSGQVELLVQLLRDKDPGKPLPEKPPVNPAPEQPEEPLPEPQPKPEDGEATELDGAVFEIFNKSCTKCHNEAKKDGQLQLVNTKSGALMYQDLPNRVEIYDRVLAVNLAKRGKSAMPKGGPRMSDKDVQTIREWMFEESDKLRLGVQ